MRIGVSAAGLLLSLVGMSTSAASDAAARQPTSISAQELAPALQILAKEHGVQVVYRSELAADHWTGGVSGNLTLEEALTQLLDATGLTYRYLADRAITIVPVRNGDELSQAARGKGPLR